MNTDSVTPQMRSNLSQFIHVHAMFPIHHLSPHSNHLTVTQHYQSSFNRAVVTLDTKPYDPIPHFHS